MLKRRKNNAAISRRIRDRNETQQVNYQISLSARVKSQFSNHSINPHAGLNANQPAGKFLNREVNESGICGDNNQNQSPGQRLQPQEIDGVYGVFDQETGNHGAALVDQPAEEPLNQQESDIYGLHDDNGNNSGINGGALEGQPAGPPLKHQKTANHGAALVDHPAGQPLNQQESDIYGLHDDSLNNSDVYEALD